MGLSLCLLISELHLVWLIPWPSCCSSASKQSCVAMPHNGDVIPHHYSTKCGPSLPLSSHTPAAGLTVPTSSSWSLFNWLQSFFLCVFNFLLPKLISLLVTFFYWLQWSFPKTPNLDDLSKKKDKSACFPRQFFLISYSSIDNTLPPPSNFLWIWWCLS